MSNKTAISNIEDLRASVEYITMRSGLMTNQVDLALIIAKDKTGETDGYLRASYNNETLSNIKLSDGLLECLVQTKAKINKRLFN